MASIFILKQIIDLVCEELTKNKSIQYQPQSIKRFEELLLKKDEELTSLYKDNIKLESRIRQIESELDVFSVINPQTKDESVKHDDETKVKNEVVEPTKQTNEIKEEQETKPKRKRDSEDRKQYMKEYGKKYRQRQREKNIEMNL